MGERQSPSSENMRPLLEDDDGAPYPADVQGFISCAWYWAHGWTDIVRLGQWKRLVLEEGSGPADRYPRDVWVDMTPEEIAAVTWLREVGPPSTEAHTATEEVHTDG